MIGKEDRMRVTGSRTTKLTGESVDNAINGCAIFAAFNAHREASIDLRQNATRITEKLNRAFVLSPSQ